MSENDEIDRINKHQYDTNTRLDTFCKSIFLICGGSLTISISLFLGNETIAASISDEGRLVLKWSWIFLFFSLISAAAVLFTLLTSAHHFGDLWIKEFKEKKSGLANNSLLIKCSDYINRIFAICCFLSFLIGMYLLAHVSINKK